MKLPSVSLVMEQFDKSQMTSYLFIVVAMFLSCAVIVIFVYVCELRDANDLEQFFGLIQQKK